MKTITKTIAAFLLLITILSSCYYDVEPNIACDTTGVTYSGTITAIISSNGCLAADCHGGANPLSGFRLTDYNSVKTMQSRLYGALSHSAGYIAMPQNAGKISQCDIDKVKAWIDAGAPNN